jgi:hypothetical protein
MICTVEEAMMRWCPMARVIEDGVTTNRPALVQTEEDKYRLSNEANCIGDACMAWSVVPGGKGSGFCGLAGK